jgi:diaminohydroxyphosphoribosylaminopyrimidine deaminase/5-amino-6-(5-phosphoribosylamino)uracil reductase
VLDPTLAAPASSQIFGLQRRKRSQAPTTVLVAQGEGSPQRRQALLEQGAALLEVPRGGDGGLDLVYTLERLIPLGISSILVEGGGATLASFHEAGLIDAWVAHVAPALIGGTGAVSPLAGQGAQGLEEVSRLSWRGVQRLGEDIELLAAVQSDVYGLD